MRHLMNPLDLTVEEIDGILDLANDIEANPSKYSHKCDGLKIATLFMNQVHEHDSVLKLL